MTDQGSIRGPTAIDYSERGTTRAVMSDTLQHPTTIIPLGLGFVAGVGVILLSPAAGVGAAIVGAGIGLGALGWGINFYGRRDSFALRYHQKLHELTKRAAEDKLSSLRRILREDVDCPQGYRQVGDLREKFQNLRVVLERSLNRGELTFSRYLGTAEQINLGMLGNLNKVVNLLISIRDIDIEDLESRIQNLESSSSRDRELNALRARKQIYDDARSEVNDLLAQNEEALTALDQASIVASNIETTSNGEMGAAMSQLEHLLHGAQRRLTTELTLNS